MIGNKAEIDCKESLISTWAPRLDVKAQMSRESFLTGLERNEMCEETVHFEMVINEITQGLLGHPQDGTKNDFIHKQMVKALQKS